MRSCLALGRPAILGSLLKHEETLRKVLAMQKLKKFLLTAGVFSIVAGSVLTAAPAMAANQPFNYQMSCVAGSVFTRATANYNVDHSVWVNGVKKPSSISYSNSATPRVTTYYSGYQVTTKGNISNPGTITNAAYNCND